MADTMPSAGTYDFHGADIVADFARQNNLRVVGHSFAWHGQVPDWLSTQSDPVIFKAHVKSFMQEMINRYDDVVTVWNVANEALSETSTGLRDTVFSQVIGPDWLLWLYSEANMLVSSSDLLLYNDYDLLLSSGKLDNAIAEIHRIRSAGGRVDGIGEQMHVTLDYPPLDDIRLSFEKIKEEDLYFHISEMDVSINSECEHPERTLDLEIQISQRYGEILKLYLDIIPDNRKLGITVWGIRNDESWLNDYNQCPEWPLLFNADGSQSLSYYRLRDILIWGF